jgi:hypothetical protein
MRFCEKSKDKIIGEISQSVRMSLWRSTTQGYHHAQMMSPGKAEATWTYHLKIREMRQLVKNAGVHGEMDG